jgi:hypothetical protein
MGVHMHEVIQKYMGDDGSSSFLRYPPHLLTRIGPSLTAPIPPDLHFPTSDPIETYPTLQEYIAALPCTHRQLLCNFHQKCSDTQLWNLFRSRRCLEIVTDGGLHAMHPGSVWMENCGHARRTVQWLWTSRRPV